MQAHVDQQAEIRAEVLLSAELQGFFRLLPDFNGVGNRTDFINFF